MYLKYTFIFILSIIFSADSIPLVESRNYSRAHKGDIKELAIKMKRKSWAGVELDTLEVTKIYLSTKRNTDSYIEAYRVGSNKKEQFYFDGKGILSHGNSDRSIQVADEISVYQMFNIILSAEVIEGEEVIANTLEPDPKPIPEPKPKPEPKIVPNLNDPSIEWVRKKNYSGEADIWIENGKTYMYFDVKDIEALYKEAVVPPSITNSMDKEIYDYFTIDNHGAELISKFKSMINKHYSFMFRVIEGDKNGLKLEINIVTDNDYREAYNHRFLNILACGVYQKKGGELVKDENGRAILESWNGCIENHADKIAEVKNIPLEEAKKEYLKKIEPISLYDIILHLNEYFKYACNGKFSEEYRTTYFKVKDQRAKVMRTLILLANDNEKIGKNRNQAVKTGSVVFDNNTFVPHRYSKATKNLILFLPLEN